MLLNIKLLGKQADKLRRKAAKGSYSGLFWFR